MGGSGVCRKWSCMPFAGGSSCPRLCCAIGYVGELSIDCCKVGSCNERFQLRDGTRDVAAVSIGNGRMEGWSSMCCWSEQYWQLLVAARKCSTALWGGMH